MDRCGSGAVHGADDYWPEVCEEWLARVRGGWRPEDLVCCRPPWLLPAMTTGLRDAAAPEQRTHRMAAGADVRPALPGANALFHARATGLQATSDSVV
jgi:hypothetical protein